jgi:CheY-like chemotaxis protein
MGPLVLVVEDFADARAIYRELLEHAGYRVSAARDGLEALAEIRGRPPDAVLLDLSLPRLSGWEVARRIRDDVEAHDTPIVAVTAHAHGFSIERARASGCDVVLVKPVPNEALLATIADVTARSRAPASKPARRAVAIEETRGPTPRKPRT